MNSTQNGSSLQNLLINIKISDIKFTVKSHLKKKKIKSHFNQSIKAKEQNDQTKITHSSITMARNSFIPRTYMRNNTQVQKVDRFDFKPLDPLQDYQEFPARKPKSVRPQSYFHSYNDKRLNILSHHKRNKTEMDDMQINQNSHQSKSCILNIHPSSKNIFINCNEQQKQQFTIYRNSKLGTRALKAHQEGYMTMKERSLARKTHF